MTETYSDELILRVLRSTRTIAMVGASAKWQRPSYFAMKYLQAKGFRVIPVNPGARTIWMQLGVINQDAAKLAREAGLNVIMNRCPKIEFGRLHAELSWGGFNSRVVTARRRRLA